MINQSITAFIRKTMVRLAMVGLSLLAICLFLEVTLRVWYGHPAHPIRWLSMGGNHPRFLFLPDSETGYRLRPFFEGYEVQPNGDFCLPVQINQWGLRDGHDLNHLQTFRILALGDSFTFGEGVPPEKTFLEIMESKLRNLRPETDCINAGTPGFGLRQMFGQVTKLVPVVKPQVLLLPFRPTFISRETAPFRYSNGYIFKPPVYRAISEVRDWVTFTFPGDGRLRDLDLALQEHSVFYLYLKYPIYDRINHAVMRRIHKTEYLKAKNVALTKEQLSVSFSILVMMNEWCRQRNISLIVVPLCSHEPEAALLTQMLTDHSLAGKPIIVTEWQNDPSKPRRLLFAHDVHLNELGHAMVADQMISILRQFYRGE